MNNPEQAIGKKIPVIFEIVSPCSQILGEEDKDAGGRPIPNKRGNKFWARPYIRSDFPKDFPREHNELLICLDDADLEVCERAADYLKKEFGVT